MESEQEGSRSTSTGTRLGVDEQQAGEVIRDSNDDSRRDENPDAGEDLIGQEYQETLPPPPVDVQRALVQAAARNVLNHPSNGHFEMACVTLGEEPAKMRLQIMRDISFVPSHMFQPQQLSFLRADTDFRGSMTSPKASHTSLLTSALNNNDNGKKKSRRTRREGPGDDTRD